MTYTQFLSFLHKVFFLFFTFLTTLFVASFSAVCYDIFANICLQNVKKGRPSMIRTYLVDDEPSVLRWLRNNVDWEQYGCTVTGCAVSAADALRELKVTPADLLITDVCMPDVNGLELIRQVHLLFPHTHIVIVSAHSRFEYVKQALRYGVENYLLKPIDLAELEETLKSILDHQVPPSLQQEKQDDLRAFRSNLLTRWVSSGSVGPDFKVQARLAGLDLSLDCYAAVLSPLPSAASMASHVEQNLLHHGIDCRCFAAAPQLLCTVLFGKNACQEDLLLSEMTRALETCLPSQQTPVFFLGPCVSQYTALPLSFRTALRFARIGPAFSDRMISCRKYPLCLHEDSALRRSFNQLALDLKGNQRQNARQTISRLWAEATRHADARRAAASFAAFLCSVSDNPDRLAQQPRLCESLSRLSILSSGTECLDWLSSFLERCMDEKIEIDQDFHPYVRQIIAHLTQNYSDCNLSIKQFASLFSVSPAYIGQLFRSQTGKYFNDYLLSLRLEAAKTLLSESDLRIGEIASRVGFSTQSYFNRSFKTASGESPLDYRIRSRTK